MNKDKINYALRPDAQAFDEVRLVTVPRYKSSELSGSEWRTSTQIQFYRKGKLVHTDGCGDMKYAVGFLYAKYHEAIDNGKGYFASDGVKCDQEGCSEDAKYLMKIKQQFCVGGGNCGAKKRKFFRPLSSLFLRKTSQARRPRP